MIEPYYSQDGITIYCGDARDIAYSVAGSVDAVIVDPVWPNVPPGMLEGSDRPHELFREIYRTLPPYKRLVVVMRNDSDPRFLSAISPSDKFLQAMWLRYAAVGHQGRFLTGNEVAYAFGSWPKSQPGRRVLPAIAPCEGNPVPRKNHPCPRSLRHMRWIVGNWSDGLVLDPCMGSGTTLVAAKSLGLPAIGIEINEAYCEAAVKRLSQQVFDFT